MIGPRKEYSKVINGKKYFDYDEYSKTCTRVGKMVSKPTNGLKEIVIKRSKNR